MADNSRTRHRRIRIFCDYSADPVWDCDELFDDLPISPGLRERMLAWARLYERKDSGVLVRKWEHGRAHVAEGLAIACEVKRQLPDWTVVYLDEAAMERAWLRGKTMRRRRLEADRARGVVSRRARNRLFERRTKRKYRGYFEYEIRPQV